MKQLLTILSILITSFAYGQADTCFSFNQDDSITTINMLGSYKPRNIILSRAHAATVCSDTAQGQIRYNAADTSIEVLGPGGWVKSGSGGGSGGGANTSLSNISSTAVNDDIIPDANNTRALGTSLLAWKNIFLPFDAGTATDPIISFYDPIHDTKIGIVTENTAGGALFIVGGGNKDVMVFDNGHTPSAWAGRVEEGLFSFASYYETSGLQGISDGNYTNGSNCALGLTTNPSLPGVSKPQYSVALSAVKTTDNTPMQIDQRAIGTNASTLFIWTIVGHRTGGSSGSEGDSFYGTYRGLYKYVAGNMVLVGSMHSEVEKDNVNLSVDFQITDNYVIVNVTGDTDNEYEWSNVVSMQQIK